MKKWLLFIVLFMFPILVNASSLVTGITVDGIGDLNLNKNSWNLFLTTTLDYVDIDVVSVDGVTVEGAGKVDVQEGENELVVKASNGTTTEEFKIKINIMRPGEDGSDNPPTGAFMPKMLITSGVLGLGVLVFVKNKKLYKV